MKQILSTASVIAVLLLLDLYIFNGIRGGLLKWHIVQKKWFIKAYWIISVCLIIFLLLGVYVKLGVGVRAALLFIYFLLFVGKASLLPFLLIDDVRRLGIWIFKLLKKEKNKPVANAPVANQPAIPRSEFLVKAGLLAGAVPLAAMQISMKSALYDYRVKHRDLYLTNLPKSFNGLKIAQISDIHSGSFFNKKAVVGGIEMLLNQKPDLIFFTGDLVNNYTGEMKDYQDIFSKVKAPLGVFSTLGNHDYGDYIEWPSVHAKKKNFEDMVTTHKNMGWHLLMNENHRLKIDGDEIGILGIENWGELSRFPKYGRMDLAVKNTDDLPVKLLLSHDPSHWRAQVLPQYPQIDMMFSGHTHGMQMGVQTEHFQWSPVEYVYKEWAGFYRQQQQQLYVNVGYGFLGFRGRVGILPEITIFILKAGLAPNSLNG